MTDAERGSIAAHSAAAARAALPVCADRPSFTPKPNATYAYDVERPDGTLQRVEFADGASWTARADDTAMSREAAVESNARQVIADLAAGRVGSQTIGDLTVAVGRAHRDAAAHRAINRGMERE